MTDNITLPRSVVEQALEALREADVLMEHFQDEKLRRFAMEALHAALDHPAQQGEREPVAIAKVVGMDEYGPMLLWNRAWTDFPVGTKLYTRPQNLHCKSNQARLAALWGYVKADQQPQGDQEPVAYRHRSFTWSPWEYVSLDDKQRFREGMGQPLYIRARSQE